MTTGRAFSFVPIDSRRSLAKPRVTGLTMVSDYQLGLAGLDDLLSMAANYIDIFKFATGTSRLYDRDYLKRKLARLRDANIRPFLGGQFQEYVLHTMGLDAFGEHLGEAKNLGFEIVEISDNVVDLGTDTRRVLLEMVCGAGLTPVGEVGAKTLHMKPADIVADVKAVLGAGAEFAIVEGQELMLNGKPNTPLIKFLKSELDVSKVMFELTTPRVGSTTPEIYKGKKFLIKTFGPNVNLGNVTPETIIETETTRLGLGSAGPLSLMEA